MSTHEFDPTAKAIIAQLQAFAFLLAVIIGVLIAALAAVL